MGLNTLLQILWLPFLLLLPLLLLLNKNKKPPKHYPPSPPKLPIIGNLHQFTQSGSSPHQNLWRLSKKFGPVMLLHLGRIPTLVISSAEAAKQVLKDNDLNCCSRPSSSGSRKLTYNYLDMGFAPYDRISGKQRQFERVSGELHRFFQQVIDDHLKPGRIQQEHDDIVGVLLKIVKEQTGFGAAHLGHDNIKALLVNLFLGGIDTGAITMLWAMAELAKNPRLMKKAQDEVRSVVGNKGNVSESDTEELPYLKMIVKESLRLHPPAPLILPRETMAPFKVLGYDVEPKTLVMINDWAISRDPEFWKDPEEFIPERFDGSSVDFKGQHFEFLPFGAGRRVCPGIYMATTTVELGLANLLYSFDWKLPEGMKEEDINMEETTGELALTISKKTALNLVPVKFSG
ncbi:PREDICTED: cytochrome P450 71B34-like isoform 3 [Fragaria vesca subsp. vesca]